MTMTTTTAETGQRDVKIFLWVSSSLALGAVALVWFLSVRLAPQPDTPAPAQRVKEFVLTERSGAAVSRAALSNQFLVVNFVHTGCSITCEQVNQRMAEVQKLAANAEDVRLLSLSIDPTADTPAALRQFAQRFGADTQRWLFLTGTKQEVYGLIEGSFLTRETNALNRTMPFRGIEQIVVVDKTGQIRRFFNGLKINTPQAVMETIAQLRRDQPKL